MVSFDVTNTGGTTGTPYCVVSSGDEQELAHVSPIKPGDVDDVVGVPLEVPDQRAGLEMTEVVCSTHPQHIHTASGKTT
jgi:hypothetical protein